MGRLLRWEMQRDSLIAPTRQRFTENRVPLHALSGYFLRPFPVQITSGLAICTDPRTHLAAALRQQRHRALHLPPRGLQLRLHLGPQRLAGLAGGALQLQQLLLRFRPSLQQRVCTPSGRVQGSQRGTRKSLRPCPRRHHTPHAHVHGKAVCGATGWPHRV